MLKASTGMAEPSLITSKSSISAMPAEMWSAMSRSVSMIRV